MGNVAKTQLRLEHVYIGEIAKNENVQQLLGKGQYWMTPTPLES